jgi:hypothetical protein
VTLWDISVSVGLEKGIYIRDTYELPGYNCSETTEIDADITDKGWERISSPLDKRNFYG